MQSHPGMYIYDRLSYSLLTTIFHIYRLAVAQTSLLIIS
jgi:hypothetical protein